MTVKEIIDGLNMTMGLITFDPSTGEDIDPDNLNNLNRTTYYACKGAVELPERSGKDINVPSNDTISRQAAIELAMQYCPDDDGTCSKADEDIRNLLDELENLPSAQPEIIQCKYCKHSKEWYKDKRRCFLWHEEGIDVFEYGYCNYGKRRTRGEQE